MLFLKREIVKQQKGHLIPKKLQVFDPRFGVIMRTYWVKPEEAQPTPSPEQTELQEKIKEAGVFRWLEEVEKEWTKLKSGSDLLHRLLRDLKFKSVDEWEREVEKVHEDLRNFLGTKRVLIPLEMEKGRKHQIPFGFLISVSFLSELLKSAKFKVPKTELPYTSILGLINLIEYFSPEAVEAPSEVFPADWYTPSIRIDPNSKQWILLSSYFKSRTEELKKITRRWINIAAINRDLDTEIYPNLISVDAPDLNKAFVDRMINIILTPKRKRLSTIEGMKKEFFDHSNVIEEALFHILPRTDAKVATAGIYGLLSASVDLLKVSDYEKTFTVNNFLEFLRERFERAVDEAKSRMGLEKFPIPYETFLWQALVGLWILHAAQITYWESVGGGDAYGEWDEEPWQFLRSLIKVEEPSPSIIWWEKDFRIKHLLDMFDTLSIMVSEVIGALGKGESKIELKGTTLRKLTDRTINTFLNLLSQAERKIPETGAQFEHNFVLIDTTPEGFSALGKDGTCFSLGSRNGHQPYVIGVAGPTFVVQFFGPEGRLGRAWGLFRTHKKRKSRGLF